jgi:HEAT repeat protein
MRRNTATADDLAPIVLELARASRASRVHPIGHPVVVDALQRGTTAWRALAGSDGEVTLDVRDAGLSLADGARLACPGAPELAGELRARGVARLRLSGQAHAQDLSHLIEILTRAPEEIAAAGGAQEVLRATGARGVTLEVVTAGDVRAPEAPEAGSFVTQHVAELVRLLAELERCDDVGSYNLLANKIAARVEVLAREKRCVDALRAALVFCRHATDAGVRSDAIRREASDRLRRLATSTQLLETIVEQACTATGLASVQATQVLIAIGAPAAGVLLRHCAETRDASRERAAQVLIAMGDSVLAAVVDELRDGSSERARRAARMLGEMQNPGGVQFLADALRSTDLALGKEAAKALARIATDPAAAALVAGLKLSAPIAETCAGCLGSMRQVSAARALGELLDLERELPDGLRREAIRSLGRLASAEALKRLQRVLDHAPFFGRARFRPLRIAAAQAIGQIGGAIAIQILQPHARRGDPEVRQACQEAIRRVERTVVEK